MCRAFRARRTVDLGRIASFGLWRFTVAYADTHPYAYPYADPDTRAYGID